MSYNSIMIKLFNREPIKELYSQGLSAQEIKDTLQLNITVRQIQRIVKEFGISRSIGDAFRNAMKRNRVKFYFQVNLNKIRRLQISPKLRFQILQRDGFKCVLCGSKEMLEVDHKDENKNNNVPANLQTLCHQCNIGKSFVHRFK